MELTTHTPQGVDKIKRYVQDPFVALHRDALRIADAAVIADIESECISEKRGDLTWYDTRQWLSFHEHPQPVIDMAIEALDYAMRRRLIVQHALDLHLVRPAVRQEFEEARLSA